MRSHLVTKRHLTIQGREDRKEIMSRQKDDVALAWEFSFKESDVKLFLKLKSSIDGLDRVLRESGKIPDWKRKEFIANMTEGYLSAMIVLHDILSSTLDVKHHSVRRVVLRIRWRKRSLMYLLQRELRLRLSHGWLGKSCQPTIILRYTMVR